jgi:hypothetical protein
MNERKADPAAKNEMDTQPHLSFLPRLSDVMNLSSSSCTTGKRIHHARLIVFLISCTDYREKAP